MCTSKLLKKGIPICSFVSQTYFLGWLTYFLRGQKRDDVDQMKRKVALEEVKGRWYEIFFFTKRSGTWTKAWNPNAVEPCPYFRGSHSSSVEKKEDRKWLLTPVRYDSLLKKPNSWRRGVVFFAHSVTAVPLHTNSLFLAECKWSLLGKSGAWMCHCVTIKVLKVN